MTTTTDDSADVDDFLAHYGVLGMHWGKRKAEPRAKGREARENRQKLAKDIVKGKISDDKFRVTPRQARENRQKAAKAPFKALAKALDLPGNRRNPTPAQKRKDRQQMLAVGGGAAIATAIAAASAFLTKRSVLKNVRISQIAHDNDLMHKGMNWTAEMGSFFKLDRVDSEVFAKSTFDFLKSGTKSTLNW